MPWSSGSFTRNQDFTSDRDAGSPEHFIQAERVDDEFDNYRAGLEALLLRNGSNSPSANVNWDGFRITNLGAPNADSDAATKQYVDSLAPGSNFVASTMVAGTITASTTLVAGSVSYPASAGPALSGLMFDTAGTLTTRSVTVTTTATPTGGADGDFWFVYS